MLTPSLSINLPPEPRTNLNKEFFCTFVLSMLEKIKDGGDSCLPRHFAKPAKKQSVLISTDHRTGDSTGELISGVYLRNSSSSCFQLLASLDLILWVCLGVS